MFSYAVYYRLAVFVATQYGDLIRASFDLFRYDLLKGLSIKIDSTMPLSREREVWEELSRLLAYGDSVNVTFETSRMGLTLSRSSTTAPSPPSNTQP